MGMWIPASVPFEYRSFHAFIASCDYSLDK